LADTKITNLTAKTTVVDADEIVINDAGTDKKIGLDDLKTFTSLSPTFVTPALGTPASGVLTNATGLPTAGLVDDAVTLGKMASGTDGNLISYDTSGNPAAVATGTSAQVLTSNGAGAAPTFQAAAGGSGGWSTVFKTSDETINEDTTLTDDTDLQFSVDASSTYAFVSWLLVDSTALADIKHALSIPSGAAGTYGQAGELMSNSLNSSYVGVSVTNSIVGSSSPAGTLNFYTIRGFVKIDTTSGTVAFQWAQNFSTTENTILKEGSWISFKKLT